VIETQTRTVRYGSAYLPGLVADGEEPPDVSSFGPTSRSWRRRVVRVGRLSVPVGRWRRWRTSYEEDS
jgi:hypothetical protein